MSEQPEIEGTDEQQSSVDSRRTEPTAEAGGPPAERVDDPEFGPFLDIPLVVRVDLDHKRVELAELLRFKEGGVIRLERSAGENVDLLLNGVVVGAGEIVVIEDLMGLRLTDVYEKGPPRRR